MNHNFNDNSDKNDQKRTRESNSSASDFSSPDIQKTKKTKSVLDNQLTMDQDDLKTFISSEIKASENRIKTEVNNLKSSIQKINLIEKKVEKLENIDRRKNIIIYGLKEEISETPITRKNTIDQLAKKLGLKLIDYDNAYRIPSKFKKPNTPLPMIIKLVRLVDKFEIMSLRHKLHPEKIYINDDLSPDERKVQAILRKSSQDARNQRPDCKTKIQRNKLIITENGSTEIYEVGEDLKLKKMTTP